MLFKELEKCLPENKLLIFNFCKIRIFISIVFLSSLLWPFKVCFYLLIYIFNSWIDVSKLTKLNWENRNVVTSFKPRFSILVFHFIMFWFVLQFQHLKELTPVSLAESSILCFTPSFIAIYIMKTEKYDCKKNQFDCFYFEHNFWVLLQESVSTSCNFFDFQWKVFQKEHGHGGEYSKFRNLYQSWYNPRNMNMDTHDLFQYFKWKMVTPRFKMF